MTTATRLYSALATALDRPITTIEAYGLALRRARYWPPTKPGRGAEAMTYRDAAKLLLAVLIGAPSQINERGPLEEQPLFLTYANAALHMGGVGDARIPILRESLNLQEDARFFDFAAAFVRLYATAEAASLVWHQKAPSGFLDPWVFDGPNTRISIQGPFPACAIRFHPSDALSARFREAGLDSEAAIQPITLAFVHEFYEMHRIDTDKDSKAGFGQFLDSLREKTARGVKFERSIEGIVFTALGKAFNNST